MDRRHGGPPYGRAAARPADGDDSGTDTDDEGRLIQQAAAAVKPRPDPSRSAQPRVHPHLPPAPVPKPAGAKGKAAPKRPAGAITLRTLLDAGFLVPGCKVLYVEYKGLITWADLTEDGYIVFEGKTFESPSAFSINVKRKVNPDRKADDGWKAVKYAGKLLEHYKEQYLRQQLLGRSGTPSAGGSLMGPSPGSSTHPSPLHGDDDEDGPPNKRMRYDGEGPMGGKPGLKIKLKLKDGVPVGGPASPAGGGVLMPVQAPPVPVVVCGAYSGSPGSGEEGAQPFRLNVSEMVTIVMDFHAHCASVEVGGLLGGTWDADSATLTVTRAFPVLEAAGGSGGGAAGSSPSGRGSGAVEFDEADRLRVLEVIKKWGLTCVGTYRSHPAYSSAPNLLDVRAQRQAADEARQAAAAAGTAIASLPPCVCAVVAPYDPNMRTPPASPVTWFHVEYDPSRPLPPLAAPSQPGAALASALPGVTPMVLEVAPQEDDIDISNLIGNLITTTFQHTARTYASRATRAPLLTPWCPGQQQLCLDKLVCSIKARLPDMYDDAMRDQYGDMVRGMVRHEFNLATRYANHAGGHHGHGYGHGYDGGSGAGTRGRSSGRVRKATRDNGEFLRFDSDEEDTEVDDDDEVQVDEDDIATDDD